MLAGQIDTDPGIQNIQSTPGVTPGSGGLYFVVNISFLAILVNCGRPVRGCCMRAR